MKRVPSGSQCPGQDEVPVGPANVGGEVDWKGNKLTEETTDSLE